MKGHWYLSLLDEKLDLLMGLHNHTFPPSWCPLPQGKDCDGLIQCKARPHHPDQVAWQITRPKSNGECMELDEVPQISFKILLGKMQPLGE
jgi:hypothetical protein